MHPALVVMSAHGALDVRYTGADPYTNGADLLFILLRVKRFSAEDILSRMLHPVISQERLAEHMCRPSGFR